MRLVPGLSEMRHNEAPRRQLAQRGGAVLRGLGALLRRYTVRNERLEVCETLSLGGRRSVALIECDGQRFLAGMSASGVETLVPVHGASPRGDLR